MSLQELDTIYTLSVDTRIASARCIDSRGGMFTSSVPLDHWVEETPLATAFNTIKDADQAIMQAASHGDGDIRQTTAIARDADLCPHDPPRKSDWDHFRPIITRLYIDEGMKMKDVKACMSATYGFNATLKMYSAHRSKWNLFKSLKASDIIALRAMEKSRSLQGKQTIFQRHGRVLDSATIHRSEKRKASLRHGDRIETHPSHLGRNISNISCLSPKLELGRISPPAISVKFESILHETDRYVRVSMACGKCVVSESDVMWDSQKQGMSPATSVYLRRHGEYYAKLGRLDASFSMYRKFFLMLEQFSDCSDPLPWLNFVQACQSMGRGPYPEIGRRALHHMYLLLHSEKFHVNLLLKSVLIRLMKLDLNEIDTFIDVFCSMLLRLWETTIGYTSLAGMKCFDRTIRHRLQRGNTNPPTERFNIRRELIESIRDNEVPYKTKSFEQMEQVYRRASLLGELECYNDAIYPLTQLVHSLSRSNVFYGDHKYGIRWIVRLWTTIADFQLRNSQWAQAKASYIQAMEAWTQSPDIARNNWYQSILVNMNWLCNNSPIADGDQRWAKLLDERMDKVIAE